MNKLEDGSGPGQGTSAEYEITIGRRVPPAGNPTKGNDLEEGRRDDGETNWASTGRTQGKGGWSRNSTLHRDDTDDYYYYYYYYYDDDDVVK